MVCILSEKDGKPYWCERHERYHVGHYAAYAVELSEKGEKFRALWDRQKAKPLTFNQRASNYISSLTEHKLTGSVIVPDEVRQARRNVCNGCEHRNLEKDACKLCGCPLSGTILGDKLGWAVSTCPINKWVKWRQPIRFDHLNLFPEVPGIRFNPSIIESGEDYIFAFRNGWAGSNIYVCRLGVDFQPYGECRKLELGRRGCGIGREDPRLFRLNGKLHIAFTGYTSVTNDDGQTTDKTNVCFARLNEETLRVEDRFLPKGRRITGWQKNWSMFDHEGIAHAVYETTPNHRILKIEGNQTEFVHSTPFAGQWSGGHMRGGASPVRVGDEWYHFFHGCYDIDGRRRYCMGVTTFSVKPPFQILRCTPAPIDQADLERNHDCWADVLFPGGAILKNGRWIVAHGIHDRWCELRFYDAAEIERQLIEVRS